MKPRTCKSCGIDITTHYRTAKNCSRECAQRGYVEDPRVYIRYNMNKRVKALGLVSDVELEDIVIPEFCPVLGIKLKSGRGRGQHLPSSPSLDRIDPNGGYVRGNIRVISYRANQLKSNATLEELRAVLADAEKLAKEQ